MNRNNTKRTRRLSSASSRRRLAPSRRRQLVEEILQAGREGSAATVMFHTVIAARAGLTATDTKTIDTLLRLGPVTAGDVARHTGLATASVTSLIDRLEKKGLVRRIHDREDRRRVIVEPVRERIAQGASVFGSVRAAYAELLDAYSTEQLETILDFMRRSGQRTREMTAELSAHPNGSFATGQRLHCPDKTV